MRTEGRREESLYSKLFNLSQLDSYLCHAALNSWSDRLRVETLWGTLVHSRKNKEESRICDSLDYQGASTSLIMPFRAEGCHPLLSKELMKGVQLDKNNPRLHPACGGLS